MTNFKKTKIAWINNELFPRMQGRYAIEEKYLPDSDFGECVGIDFEGNEKVGYIYFWSSGMLGFGFFDIKNNKSIIDQEFIELLNMNDLQDIIAPLLFKL